MLTHPANTLHRDGDPKEDLGLNGIGPAGLRSALPLLSGAQSKDSATGSFLPVFGSMDATVGMGVISNGG